MCEKSFSEDRLIKSHIKTNHPGKAVQLEGEMDMKTLTLVSEQRHPSLHRREQRGRMRGVTRRDTVLSV